MIYTCSTIHRRIDMSFAVWSHKDAKVAKSFGHKGCKSKRVAILDTCLSPFSSANTWKIAKTNSRVASLTSIFLLRSVLVCLREGGHSVDMVPPMTFRQSDSSDSWDWSLELNRDQLQVWCGRITKNMYCMPIFTVSTAQWYHLLMLTFRTISYNIQRFQLNSTSLWDHPAPEKEIPNSFRGASGILKCLGGFAAFMNRAMDEPTDIISVGWENEASFTESWSWTSWTSIKKLKCFQQPIHIGLATSPWLRKA